MSFNFYGLDERARKLIKNQIERARNANFNTKDTKILIKESHKMRQTVIYGLERFWGEQIRLQDSNQLDSAKALFWQDTWNQLVEIITPAEVNLPKNQEINQMADQLWNLSHQKQQIALAVLTQFCDSLVWWTQRYKSVIGGDDDE